MLFQNLKMVNKIFISNYICRIISGQTNWLCSVTIQIEYKALELDEALCQLFRDSVFILAKGKFSISSEDFYWLNLNLFIIVVENVHGKRKLTPASCIQKHLNVTS